MACQKKYFYWFLLSCVLLTVFSECKTSAETIEPITKAIIRKVREDDKKGPEYFQYYVSKKITLELTEIESPFKIENGKLIKGNNTTRRRITISKDLPGIIPLALPVGTFPSKLSDGTLPSSDGDKNLLIGFEKDHHECVIWFGQRTGSDRYYLLYDKKSIVEYGGYYYIVNFSGKDIPYLNIISINKPEGINEERDAIGRKLGE